MGGNGAPCDAVPIIVEKCHACHSTAGKAAGAGLDLEVAGFAAALVGAAPSMASNAACTTYAGKLLEPGSSPATGLFLLKLEEGNPPRPCGVKMPQVGSLTAADKACFQSWANGLTAGGGGGGAMDAGGGQ
jgi:hypothetical protein